MPAGRAVEEGGVVGDEDAVEVGAGKLALDTYCRILSDFV